MTSELLAAGEALAELLEAENRALIARELDAVPHRTAAKSAALARFQDARSAAVAGGASADMGRLPAVEAMLRRLDGAAAENRRLLERAIAVQGRILDIVTSAMKAPTAPYRPAGRQPGPCSVAPMVICASA